MPEMTITVKCSNDTKYTITIDTSKTILEFKQFIAEKSDIATDRQRLIYSGKVLKDDDTLETCKIAEGHTVHMVRSLARGMLNVLLYCFYKTRCLFIKSQV